MTVTLEPDEVLICEQLGRLRSLVARSAGVVDAKIGKQDGSEADVMGIKAEYAFAKARVDADNAALRKEGSGSAEAVGKSQIEAGLAKAEVDLFDSKKSAEAEKTIRKLEADLKSGKFKI